MSGPTGVVPDGGAAVASSAAPSLPPYSVALITTFSPEPYELKRELAVTIYPADDAYIASSSTATSTALATTSRRPSTTSSP